MPERTAEVNRLDFLIGQVQALKSFVLAAAATHAEPVLLKKHFEKSSQVALAKIESKPVGDRTIDGFQHVTDEIFSILATFEEPPESR